MDAKIAVLNWIFAHPIYPIVGTVLPLYLGLRSLKRRFPTAPDPAYVIGTVILIEMLVVPSVPRYLFEHATLARVKDKPWIRVVDQMRWSSASEPLTWMKTPLGSATLIMPDPSREGAFRQAIMRYGRDPVVTTVDVDCERSTIIYARRGEDGVYLDTTPSPLRMNSVQKRRYCDYDWTREKEAFRSEDVGQTGDRDRNW